MDTSGQAKRASAFSYSIVLEPDPRSPIQFSDHADCKGALFFNLAAELGLVGIVSRRAASRYRSGPSRSWHKTKNMVESEFIFLGTEIDDSGIPWALLAREHDGELEFAGPAILRPPSHARAQWAEKFATMTIERPVLKGLRRANKAVAEAGDQGQGSAPQDQGNAQACHCQGAIGRLGPAALHGNTTHGLCRE